MKQGTALDYFGVLAALGAAGYDRCISVKVHRKMGWEESARASAEFLRGLDAALDGSRGSISVLPSPSHREAP